MVVVLRAGLVRGPEVDTRLAAAAVFYETLTTMAAGGALAALLMVSWLHARWQFAALVDRLSTRRGSAHFASDRAAINCATRFAQGGSH